MGRLNVAIADDNERILNILEEIVNNDVIMCSLND